MAQKVHIVLVDDLDGTEATETVSFGLDGTSYEIDLNDKNAAALRDALAGYVGHARKVSGARRGAPQRSRPRPRAERRQRQGDPRLGPLQRLRRPRPRPHLRRRARGLRRRALTPRRRVGATLRRAESRAVPSVRLVAVGDGSAVRLRRPAVFAQSGRVDRPCREHVGCERG